MSQIAWLRAAVAVTCLACSLFVFYPGFDNGFWRDDFVLLQRAHAAQQQPEILLQRWVEPFNRPLAQFVFHLEYLAWGLEPGLYILTNTLLHALNATLLFVLLQFPLGAPAAAAAAFLFALGFGFYGKAVLWAANLAELLATTFLLATAIAALHAQLERTARARLAAMATAGVFYALALLTKESAIMAIVMVAALMWPHRRNVWSLTRKLAILVAVCAGYITLQILSGSGIGQVLRDTHAWLSLPLRALNLAVFMLLPVQSESTLMASLSPLVARILAFLDQIRPLVGLLLLGLYGAWFWRGSGAVRFLLTSYLGFLLPFGLIHLSGDWLDIRYAYLPATCLCGLLAIAFRWLWLRGPGVVRPLLALSLVVALLGELTLVRRLEAKYDAFGRSEESQAALNALREQIGGGP